MQVIKYLRLPFHFDKLSLQEELYQLSTKTWKRHYQVAHYEGEWSAIPLRSQGGKTDDIYIDPNANYSDTVFLASSPYLQTVLQTFQCPLHAVRLMKLNAGAIIKEHRDIEMNFEQGEARFHIPITTHEEVEFYLDGERIHLKEGECWYMNFNLPHRVHNNSPVDRVHLVIDVEVNDWLTGLFAGPSIPVKKETTYHTDNYGPAEKSLMISLFREMNTAASNKMADDLEEELAASGKG